jgi:hypothetical protein
MAPKPSDTQASEREARLSKLLHAYIKGGKDLRTARDGKLLLEAISAQGDGASCVERFVASKNALEALRLALRFDLTPGFFNTTLKDFLTFLQNPAIKQLCGGDLLKQLLTMIVCPETLWAALLAAYSSTKLSSEGELAFAWLLLELASWVENPPLNVESIARDLTQRKVFIKSNDLNLRTIGYRLENVLETTTSARPTIDNGPGGRHDNDHANFRRVAIFPTDDELMCTEQAFYQAADAMSTQPFKQRPGAHLDNQFRLLREDFLAEIREGVKTSQSNAKGGQRPRFRLRGLSLVGAHYGTERFRTPFTLVLSVKSGLENFARLGKSRRKAYLKDNPKFMKHQSFGGIIDRKHVVAFVTVLRIEELLIGGSDDDDDYHEPRVVIRAPDKTSLEKLLTTLKSSRDAEFVMIDAPVFAYEPVLRCLQSTVELPLWQELFAISGEEIEAAVRLSEVAPLDLIRKIENKKGHGLQPTLSLPKPVDLDASQLGSLLAGLRQSVSLIQGPPGTGKSFIGALLTRALLDNSSETILIVCYTNHALDQFLEDLLDIGIPAKHMVRLGAKSTPRTEPLQLYKQPSHDRPPYDLINTLKSELDDYEASSRRLLSSLQALKLDWRSLMEYLEFSDDDCDFFPAFQVPDHADGTIVGKKGKAITDNYLYERWRDGNDAGVLKNSISADHRSVWAMDKTARSEKIRRWTQEILQERIAGVSGIAGLYDHTESTLRDAWDQKNSRIIQNKRIIACTTTAAAKYTKQLSGAAPGIIIVEEAGEILESHVLTAMTPGTKQLVLIGDHQQLRPKVNNYSLTVEKGEGYDLNRSLFERLIRAGIPHTTLQQQHRMCPEISSLVRQLTYPDLVDAPSTLNRDPIKGIRGRVVFIDHRQPELAASQVADRGDQGTPTSKQNPWEASMILKIVRYMAQQGYGTTDQVVITPYLGQLNLLRQELAKENDPVLNDLDSSELIKAGLMSPANASLSKRSIRLSTIGM